MSLLQYAIDTFRQAAELNLEDPVREGSLLNFADYGQVVMTGDMHGHRRNFEKLVKYCRLEETPIRHVILHELIHEEPQSYGAHDRSIELLLDAAKWKTFFPEQIHFLQSNHELAQLQNHQISKGGRIVTDDFDRGVAEVLGTNDIDEALQAIDEFLASLPLAGRTPNGVFLAHSLPDAAYMDQFDTNCLHRAPNDIDMREGGSVYQLVWGRRYSPTVLDQFSKAYDVSLFVVGHQPQEFGFEVKLDRVLIIASDNNHGVFLPIDCSKRYTMQQLVDRIRPFAGVA